MGILSWILLGLIAGALAKYIMPGKDSGGFIVTTLLGIAGAFVGGAISSFLGIGSFTGWNIKSMVIAVIGAVLVLAIWRKIKK
ncbi:transglycosylase associated protein [Candidatus Moduliflexus flocculans]|uniref:Transglycosylase associated protein n=1 Tax=Candidatus Moduliflexus flocculans TaxID=1499966 RepID=A0A081BN81_9BACT|nr:transglycosylase associated protein [Candidatus Moduliflexus flocculans]